MRPRMNRPTPGAFEAHEAPTLTGSRGLGSRSPLVLVVDDDADARDIYSECLAHLGYRVLTEASGEGAVTAASRMHPDAILMDVSMPGMGGIEATRRIRSDPSGGHCLIIVITAYGASMFAEARRAGCDAYFCKPFNAFALDDVLRVLGSAPSPRPQVAVETVKRCGCGLQYTRETWAKLRLIGRMHSPRGGPAVELRNCTCGSSIALETWDVLVPTKPG
jgi:two-component system cell cycle response regulator DivK